MTGSDVYLQTTPNTWLVSNSSLYFANRLLEGDSTDPYVRALNVYSIFDLCILSESILIADKVVTLPNRPEVVNSTTDLLKGSGIIEELDIDRVMERAVGLVKYPWKSEFLSDENKENLTKIMCGIFPVDKHIAYHVVENANMWAGQRYQTPDWDKVGDASVRKDVFNDDNRLHKFKAFPEQQKMRHKMTGSTSQYEDAMYETLVRAMFYLKISSERGFNYYPDSIRVPIVAYINSWLKLRLNSFAQKLIMQVEESKRKELEDFAKEGLGFGSFEINTPSCFNLILRSCNDKDDFIGRALELREDGSVGRLRRYITEIDGAFRVGDYPKVKRLLGQKETVLASDEGIGLESFLCDIAPDTAAITTSFIGGIDYGSAINSSATLGTKAYEYLKALFPKRRLLFLHDVGKRVQNISLLNDKLESLFGSKLSDEQIISLGKLREYHVSFTKGIPASQSQTTDNDNRQNVHTSEEITQKNNDEPLKVLKMRLAKGEISKEEYSELRKLIES